MQRPNDQLFLLSFYSAKTRGENVTQHNQPKLLLELLEILFERFRCVAVAHMTVLGALQRVSVSWLVKARDNGRECDTTQSA